VKLTLAVVLVLAGLSGPAVADNNHGATSTIPGDATFVPKKMERLAEKAEASDLDRKAWHRTLAKRRGKAPKTVVNIYNTWTHETVPFAVGETPTVDEAQMANFLRCHFTNEPTSMDPRLFSVLVKAANKFRANRIEIISGFRDPKYNLMLRKKGRNVARNSQHPQGNAVDFRIPGVNVKRLRSWASSLHLGGVGFYPHSRFVHVDVGPVRSWTGK